MTLMSIVVAVSSTLTGVLMIWLTVVGWRAGRRPWKRRKAGSWRVRWSGVMRGRNEGRNDEASVEDERQALLENG